MPNARFTDSQIKTIEKMLARGERIADIARYLGRDPQSVSKRIKKLGLKPTKRPVADTKR
jgi:DNA-binding MarR family transcriptional regulator